MKTVAKTPDECFTTWGVAKCGGKGGKPGPCAEGGGYSGPPMQSNKEVYRDLAIASKHFPGVETLQTRGSDSLDFHEVHVTAVKDALKEIGGRDLTDKDVAYIAKEYLGIENLTERKSDSLDFHDVSVANIKGALHAAQDFAQMNWDKKHGGKKS